MKRLRSAFPTALPVCVAALGVFAGLPAAAQGTGTAPWVLDRTSAAAQATSPSTQTAVAQFSAAYARAGKPRVALFWNRELSDRTELSSQEVTRLNAQRSRDGNSVSLTATQGRESAALPERSTSLSERDLWLVETEFTQRLLDAGTAVIDRATAMRLVAAGASPVSGTPNIEMSALIGKADLLLEVLLTRDTGAPMGWGFRSNLKDIRTGQLLGSQYLSAMPELPQRAESGFRVGAKGYERVEAEPVKVSLRAVGETLAAQALAELARRLPAR